MQEPTNDGALSWIVTGLSAGYVVWTGITLARRVSAFANLFSSLGAELPLATRFAIGANRPPIVWSVVAILLMVLLANQLRIVRPGLRLAVSVIVFMITAMLSSLVTEAMFVPLFQLIRQIG
jgi:hypothetical protein